MHRCKLFLRTTFSQHGTRLLYLAQLKTCKVLGVLSCKSFDTDAKRIDPQTDRQTYKLLTEYSKWHTQSQKLKTLPARNCHGWLKEINFFKCNFWNGSLVRNKPRLHRRGRRRTAEKKSIFWTHLFRGWEGLLIGNNKTSSPGADWVRFIDQDYFSAD